MQREYQISNSIKECRRNGDIEEAIRKTNLGISEFPESDFFYKILGDLLFDKNDYLNAGNAYVSFLTKIGNELQYFKNFVKFWEKFVTKAKEEEIRQVYDCIVQKFDENVFSAELNREIAVLLFEVYPQENVQFKELYERQKEIREWIKRQERDHKLWNIYRFLFWKDRHIVFSKDHIQTEKYLVSVMERYELYSLALASIKNVLKFDHDEVAVRTLFRLCRKVNDYFNADEYLQEHPEIEKSQGFNIQYELVYYYLNKNNETGLLAALKNIRISAESSIPISRTLQNFYVMLGMIDEAVAMRKHIEYLLQKYNKAHQEKKDKDIKGAKEEKETDEVFWDTIKDMVSEQEHNRQLIAIKELLRGFSHELGQPITNIRYGIQLYQMKEQRILNTTESIQELLNNILDQTIRVKNLLDRFAPIVSSKSENKDFNCISHIKDVFENMKMRLAAMDINYQVYGIDQFTLYGDSVQFEQVIYNLISNAADELRGKAGERMIEVECRAANNHLNIHFRDNGKGVPVKSLNKIFTPFYSTKDKNKTDGGEGLGLYMVWNILKMYGGKIKVNTAYKGGAEFLIIIPGGNENV